MKLLEILKHEDALKFSKEARLALKNGQVQVNGNIVTEDIELNIEDFMMEQEEFFFAYFAKAENQLSHNELFAFRFIFDIPTMFDTSEPWGYNDYKRFKPFIDFLSGFIHLKVSKKKAFVLMRA